MKQWQLPNNSKVEIPDGRIVTFLGMDGMYARWDVDDEIQIGNFDEFEKTESGYRVVEPQSMEGGV